MTLTSRWSGVGVVTVLYKMQGPVVRSVVSLTSSLRVISLTVLADSIYNILIFFAEKMWVAFALQKKFQHIYVSLDVNFNELLTNDVVSIEQLGPGVFNLGQVFKMSQYQFKIFWHPWVLQTLILKKKKKKKKSKLEK